MKEHGKRKSQIVFVIISLTLVIALLASCGIKNTGKVSPDWYSERHSIKTPLEDSKDDHEKPRSTMIPEPVAYTLDELLERSGLVVIGKVLGFDYLTVSGGGDYGEAVYTDYYVDVLEPLRGEAKTDKNGLITIRAIGGENNDYIEENGSFDLTVGNEYLFFLWLPDVGGYTNTKGNNYMPFSMSMSIFTGGEEKIANSNGVEVPAVFTPYERSMYLNEPLDYAELSEYISEYNGTHPVNETFFTDEIMDRFKERVEKGTMTQEEFDSYLDSLDKYATILYYTE